MRADDAGAEVVEPADVVDDREGRDVVEERVDREVAAEGVLFRRAERVVVMNQAPVPCSADALAVRATGTPVGHHLFAGGHLPPERGDLDHLRAELHVRQPEAPADDPAVSEELLHLVRMRGGADVEILRRAARAAGRGRCRRRGRRCGRTGAAGRAPSARRGRCPGARSSARRAGRSLVRPSAGIVPNMISSAFARLSARFSALASFQSGRCPRRRCSGTGRCAADCMAFADRRGHLVCARPAGTSNSSSSWTVRIIRACGRAARAPRGRRSSRASGCRRPCPESEG